MAGRAPGGVAALPAGLLYLLQRLGQLVPTVLTVSLIAFVLIRLSGDTTLAALAALKPVFRDGQTVKEGRFITAGNASQLSDGASASLLMEATEAERRAFRDAHGLDRSLPVQYLVFLGNLLRGDLGTSFWQHEPALRVVLGRFPATIQLAPGGNYAWVVNFNLYGDMIPSTVSVVYTDPMIEVKRIPTCVMPHGSRLSPDGSRHYSACMMNDVLVEVDAAKMEVSRHFMLKKGAEHGMEGAPGAMEMTAGADGHGMAPPKPGEVSCSPTWAQPSTDGKTVWVACNKSSDLVEIDVASWSMRRRIPAGDGIYNLAVTHDGRLVVGTNKRGKSVSIIDATSGAELARIPTTRRVPSGLVISPDDRYAFVTLEGVGSEPGTVEIIDLRAMARVASVDVGQQAGGIDFWKTEPH